MRRERATPNANHRLPGLGSMNRHLKNTHGGGNERAEGIGQYSVPWGQPLAEVADAWQLPGAPIIKTGHPGYYMVSRVALLRVDRSASPCINLSPRHRQIAMTQRRRRTRRRSPDSRQTLARVLRRDKVSGRHTFRRAAARRPVTRARRVNAIRAQSQRSRLRANTRSASGSCQTDRLTFRPRCSASLRHPQSIRVSPTTTR